jgi:hypothetical protein
MKRWGFDREADTMTRIFAIIGALAASTLLGGWAFDRQGPYCLMERNQTNCGYPSFEACIASSRGVGGFCQPNPMYVPDRRVAKYQRRNKHH